MFVAKRFKIVIALICLSLSVATNSVSGYAASTLLKKGMSGSEVTQLQNNLKQLGFFQANSTGYFGDVTWQAVSNFQKKNGLVADGIVGPRTLEILDKMQSASTITVTNREQSNTSRGEGNTSRAESSYLGALPWFEKAEKVFYIGGVAEVLDITSGKIFNIKRTYGYNHADVETVTTDDTNIMKQVYNGTFSWNRRPIILTIEGKKIAASMAGMPHAGLDKFAPNIYVSGRSEGYGYGHNLDTVKGNNMDGHFDIHLAGSKTHGTKIVDTAHQLMIQKAATWAEKNLVSHSR